MLSKCLRAVATTTFRYNSFTFTLKPLKISECKQIKNLVESNNRQFSSSFSQNSPKNSQKTTKSNAADNSAQSVAYYSMAVAVICAGLTYAAVPLYRMFCQV